MSPPAIDGTDRNEVLASIRGLFGIGGPQDREQAIRLMACAMGYDRLGSRIREIISNDLQTAVRRGILSNSGGEYSAPCQSIEDYSRDHLVKMLVAAMGSSWQTRAEATTAAARYLGFRRTGSKIAVAFKSAINAAIRRNLIERDGPEMIRKAK